MGESVRNMDFSNPLGPTNKEDDEYYGGSKPGKPKTPKPPPAPDPYKIIDYQANVNRTNEQGPSGSTVWSKDADGRWTQTKAFSPELQQVYNKQLGLIGEDPNAYNEKVSNAMF